MSSLAKIIKGIAGFYYCHVLEGEYSGVVFSCKAKGIFRKLGKKPLVGDNVDIEFTDIKDLEGNIVRIYERKNELIRPAISNIDQVIIVNSVREPSPALFYLDRYLVMMKSSNIKISLCWNKADLSMELAQELSKGYEEAGYENFIISAKDGSGMDELKKFLLGKVSVFAGASGVGKSTITNLLIPDANMQTNSVSKKIERGRHTTRHSEIFSLNDNTFVFDTPGFTSITPPKIESSELRFYFSEFDRFEGRCRFSGCTHTHEPDCALKDAIFLGEFTGIRYESYKKMYKEILERRGY